ncbi:MAG TPA: hypothetical protein EYP62_04930 [Kiritimatiellae bacterium]|nr:hypothetical protein [Kiritimatiellia bacterium]
MRRLGAPVSRPMLWLSLLMLSSGIVAFLVFRTQAGVFPHAREAASVFLGLVVFVSGILLIIGTHRWWFTR